MIIYLAQSILNITQGQAYKLSISDVISFLFRFFQEIALPIAGGIALIFLIIGGIQYIFSGGSEEKVAGARQTMTYAIIGVVIIALAYGLVVYFERQLCANAPAGSASSVPNCSNSLSAPNPSSSGGSGPAPTSPPSQTDPQTAIQKAKEMFKAKYPGGQAPDNGPCLGNIQGMTGWVADIAHNPRRAVDELSQNQCPTGYSHFVELDLSGNVIRSQ